MVAWTLAAWECRSAAGVARTTRTAHPANGHKPSQSKKSRHSWTVCDVISCAGIVLEYLLLYHLDLWNRTSENLEHAPRQSHRRWD